MLIGLIGARALAADTTPATPVLSVTALPADRRG
jgi:hypothetical protein